MRYFKFVAETPYCGTENTYYEAYSDYITNKELDEIAEDFRRENAEGFEYLVSGWDDENFEGLTEEEREEEIANYYADCYCSWEEITKEEYEGES